MRRGCLVVLLFAIPLFLWAVAGSWIAWNLSVLGRTEAAVGVVVDLIRETSSDGPTFRPVVEFVDARGEPHRFERSISFGGGAVPDIGRKWTVAYDPDDPSDVRVIGIAFWLGPALFGLGALVSTLVAGTIFFASRAGRRRREAGPFVQTASGLSADPEAEFRRVESDFDADGALRYRVVAVTPTGEQLFSDWLDEDPTTEFVQSSPPLRIVTNRGERRVTW